MKKCFAQFSKRNFLKVLAPLTFAAVAMLLSGCDTIHGVERPVPMTTSPDTEAIKQSLQTVKVDYFNSIRAGSVTVFSLRRGVADVSVRYDSEAKPKNRLILYSITHKTAPSPAVLAADRVLLDETYATLHRDIPGLPSHISEYEVNLSRR